MELSIIIITINRKEKLCRAIDSCLKCSLPRETEFIIVDNGSTDGSELAVRSLLSSFPFKYYKYDYNTGASHARNKAIDMAEGEILYFLDDDAYIPEEYYSDFFKLGVDELQNNKSIGALTTGCWDVAYNDWRKTKKGKKYSDNYPLIYEVHGGSCFVRNGILKVYFPDGIKYGYEEVYMCIKILNEGYYSFETNSIYIIHDPDTGKWMKDGKVTKEHMIKAVSGLYSVKYLLYPKIYRPLIGIGCIMRWAILTHGDFHSLKEIRKLHKEQCIVPDEYTISNKTILKIAKEFGIKNLI